MHSLLRFPCLHRCLDCRYCIVHDANRCVCGANRHRPRQKHWLLSPRCQAGGGGNGLAWQCASPKHNGRGGWNGCRGQGPWRVSCHQVGLAQSLRSRRPWQACPTSHPHIQHAVIVLDHCGELSIKRTQACCGDGHGFASWKWRRLSTAGRYATPFRCSARGAGCFSSNNICGCTAALRLCRACIARRCRAEHT